MWLMNLTSQEEQKEMQQLSLCVHYHLLQFKELGPKEVCSKDKPFKSLERLLRPTTGVNSNNKRWWTFRIQKMLENRTKKKTWCTRIFMTIMLQHSFTFFDLILGLSSDSDFSEILVTPCTYEISTQTNKILIQSITIWCSTGMCPSIYTNIYCIFYKTV